jgi:hypothetical protein
MEKLEWRWKKDNDNGKMAIAMEKWQLQWMEGPTD